MPLAISVEFTTKTARSCVNFDVANYLLLTCTPFATPRGSFPRPRRARRVLFRGWRDLGGAAWPSRLSRRAFLVFVCVIYVQSSSSPHTGALPATAYATTRVRKLVVATRRSARQQSARHIRSGHGASCEGARRRLSRVDDHEYRLSVQLVEGQSGTLSVVCAHCPVCGGRG